MQSREDKYIGCDGAWEGATAVMFKIRLPRF